MKTILKIILIGLLSVSAIFAAYAVSFFVHEAKRLRWKERIIDTYRQSHQENAAQYAE